jgi:hypothetical protein
LNAQVDISIEIHPHALPAGDERRRVLAAFSLSDETPRRRLIGWTAAAADPVCQPTGS